MKYLQSIPVTQLSGPIELVIDNLKAIKSAWEGTHKHLKISLETWTEPGDYGPVKGEEYVLEGIKK